MEANQEAAPRKLADRLTSTGRSTDQDSSMQSCIEICIDCSTSCLQLIPYCLKHGEDHAEATHILHLQNCAEICQTSAKLMISNSAFSPAICEVCADICNLCADDCDKFDDDQKMKQCADLCRKCADSCMSMAKMA